MNELFENKLFWVAIVLGVLQIGAFVGGPMIIDRVADKVINKLQKDYTPGPYWPGVDPDKVDPRFFRNQPPGQQPPVGPPADQWPPSQPPQRVPFIEGEQTTPPVTLPDPGEWNEMWKRLEETSSKKPVEFERATQMSRPFFLEIPLSSAYLLLALCHLSC